MLRAVFPFATFALIALSCSCGRSNRSGAPTAAPTGETSLASGESIVTLTTARGARLSFVLGTPASPPTRALVLLAGGGGQLALSSDGIGKPDNFVVRTRAQWVADGFVVAVPDVPSDHPDGLEGFRTSKDHADDLGEVIAWLKQHHHVPVWLVGTSRGTISAANAAARLGSSGGPNGLVLTSSVTVEKKGKESLYDIALDRITIPVLLMHHREDGCGASPFSGVDSLQNALKNAATVKIIAVDGGGASGEPCGPFHHHGYEGIEEKVVNDAAAFISAQP